jgi:glycosyltransferase 2 family protein
VNNQVKSALKYLISAGLTVLFLYFAFKGTDFESLWQIMTHANYWWALSSLPALLISHMLRAWRWEYFLRPVKPGLKYRNLFSATMIGYMLNNLFSRLGEIGRPYAIWKQEGVSRSAALGTVFIERIFDILSFMVVVALIPLVYSGPLTQVFPWLEQTGIWLTIISLLFMGLFVFLMVRRDIVVRMLNAITRHLSPKRAKLVEHITHSFLDGFLFLKEPKHYFMIILLSILVWVFYILMVYLPFYAFDMTAKYGLDMGTALVVQAISNIGFILPTPGGTGSYHYFVIQTLTKLYGVNEEVARSYATLTHAIGFIGTTLVGFYYFFKDKIHLGEMGKREMTQAPTEEKSGRV